MKLRQEIMRSLKRLRETKKENVPFVRKINKSKQSQHSQSFSVQLNGGVRFWSRPLRRQSEVLEKVDAHLVFVIFYEKGVSDPIKNSKSKWLPEILRGKKY